MCLQIYRSFLFLSFSLKYFCVPFRENPGLCVARYFVRGGECVVAELFHRCDRPAEAVTAECVPVVVMANHLAVNEESAWSFSRLPPGIEILHQNFASIELHGLCLRSLGCY